jgi:hypothetical protein
MNYIQRLKKENDELKASMEYAIELLIEHQAYFNGDKFKGIENDYAHVTTDVYPKISAVKIFLAGSLNKI